MIRIVCFCAFVCRREGRLVTRVRKAVSIVVSRRVGRTRSRRDRSRGKTDGGGGELDEIFFRGGDGAGGAGQLHNDELSWGFKNGAEKQGLGKILGGATGGASSQGAFIANEGKGSFGTFFCFGLGVGWGSELGTPAIEVGLNGATLSGGESGEGQREESSVR